MLWWVDGLVGQPGIRGWGREMQVARLKEDGQKSSVFILKVL